MVSIMPGMENFEPLRTDTSSGSTGSPSFFPMSPSSFSRAAALWVSTSGGRVFPRS